MVLTSQRRPAAPRVAHREMRQAATVSDDYFWCAKNRTPKVVQYLEADNGAVRYLL